ncbi:unnamed protein product [Merluccius merluccius]
MAAPSEPNARKGTAMHMKEPFEVMVVTKTQEQEHHPVCRSTKDVHKSADEDKGVASFSTNHNSVVCLPLVSEGLKLVWTQADQTRELDAIPELVQAFNLFPYPTSREVGALARACALPLDKVKVWFMVQRIKYGISWASEEIEETRRKLSVPELTGDCVKVKNAESPTKGKRKSYEAIVMVDGDSGHEIEGARSTSMPPKKKSAYESPESYKPARPAVPCFKSSLPPPQDSYYYRPPVDTPATVATDVSLDLSIEASTPQKQQQDQQQQQQRRHGRYKKSKAQLAVLRASFLRENWPTETELRRLQEETGLSRNDIRKWFSDSRYQLRVGRGALGAAQSYSQPATAETQDGLQQLQPLPLISQKTHQQQNGLNAQEATRGSGIKDSHFFRTFLTNSLEAFGERVVEAEEEAAEKEASSNGDHFVEDESEPIEEKPLQLTKTTKTEKTTQKMEPPPQTIEPPLPKTEPPPPKTEPPPPPPQMEEKELKPSPCPSPASTPPPTASPTKRLSNGVGTSKKSSHSTKAGSPPAALQHSQGLGSSSSPALTPAGRPRKTKEQLDVLKQHFLRCQWPKSEDYTELVKLTGLPRADVIQWFGDTRYAVKNGQLRWVQGVRKQFLAELAMQQSNGGVTNGNSASATPRGGGGSRKRKSSQAAGTAANTATLNIQPLETYHRSTGKLQEKDLDFLCKKSRMSYQQVREWFASQEAEAAEETGATE